MLAARRASSAVTDTSVVVSRSGTAAVMARLPPTWSEACTENRARPAPLIAFACKIAEPPCVLRQDRDEDRSSWPLADARPDLPYSELVEGRTALTHQNAASAPPKVAIASVRKNVDDEDNRGGGKPLRNVGEDTIW